jgi:hypothetical protein
MDKPSVSLHRFFWGWGVASAIGSLYSIALAFSVPWDLYLSTWKNEMTWSLFCVVLLPVSFGLWLSILDLRIIVIEISKVSWIIVAILGAIILLLSAIVLRQAIADSYGIPTPDRIAERKLQRIAVEADKCLRLKHPCDCKNPAAKELTICKETQSNERALNTQCREKISAISEINNYLDFIDQIEADSEGSKARRAAYFCNIVDWIEQTTKRSINFQDYNAMVGHNAVSIAALILNFVIFEYVVVFIISFFVLMTIYLRTTTEIVWPLFFAFVFLASWIPIRLYPEWHQWYSSIEPERLKTYQAFVASSIAALILGVAFSIWILRQEGQWKISKIVGGVGAVIGGAWTGLAYFNPKIADYIFDSIWKLNEDLWVMMIVFLLFPVAGIALNVVKEAAGSSSVGPAITDDSP